jgi:hypothetical protein
METMTTGRIAGSLLDRRWVHFAIELVLVVVGILIALAIDGWSDEREQRRSEQAYLELLARDLGQIESQLQQQIDFETSMANTSVAAYDLIQNLDPAGHSDQIGKMLVAVSVRRTLFLESAAYTDLISTGSLGLIRDRGLRDRITRYFADAERRELIVEKNNRVFVDDMFLALMVDHGVSYHLWKDSPVGAAMNFESISSVFSPAMREPVDEVLSLPKDAPEWARVKQLLSWRTMVAVVARDNAASILAATVELRKDLEAHLGQY